MNDQERPDWIEFDGMMGGAKELIDRLPSGFHKDQTLAKFAELCYWFNEAQVEAINEQGRFENANAQEPEL